MRFGLSVRHNVALAASIVFTLPVFTGCDEGSTAQTGAQVKDAPVSGEQKKTFDQFYNTKTGKGSGAGAQSKVETPAPAPATK